MKSYDKVEVIEEAYDRVFYRYFHIMSFNKKEGILFYGRLEGVMCTLCFGALVYGGKALIKKVTN